MSTTVDSKVVELSLENGKFESNAQKSLSTIDKLKQSLNFNNTVDGLENIGSSLKNINFNILNKGIETAKRGFSALDAIAYGALFRIGQKVTDVTAQLITAVPQQIITGGKRRAMNIEQAKFQLKGLKVAWEDIVGDIDYAVTDTAYGLDEAARVASQLVASSVQLGEPMRKALRGISGVAAMTNSSYDEIGHVFTTVAGQGRLMAEQLNSLAARGLNVAAVMGESMGKTEAEIREMVSKGKIDFQTFANAMDDAFGEHATSANETFTGVFSNIKANLSKIGELFAIPAYEGLKRVFNGLLPLIKDVRIELTPLSKDFESVFLAICDGVAAAFDTIHAAIKGDRRSIGEIIRDHFFPESKEVKKEGEKTVTAVEGIHDKALAVIRDYHNLEKFGEEGYDTQQIQDYVNLLYKLTNGTWNITDAILAEADAQMNITETAEDATEATKEVTDSAEEMTKQYDDAYSSMSNAELGVLGIAQIMQGINYAIAMIGQEFEGVFSADKNELVRNAMVAFEDLSKAFRNFSFKHGENIGKILHGLYSGFKIVADVVWMVIRIIGNAFSIVWDAFGDDIMNFLGWVGQGITKVQEWMETHEVFQKVVDGVSNTFRTAVETVRSWIDTFLAMPEVQTTIEKFKHAFDLVFDDFSGLLHETGEAFNTFFGDIGDAFKVLNETKDPQQFFDALGVAFDNLGKFFSEQDWFQAFQDAFGSVGDIFGSIGESFQTWLDDFRAKMKGTLVGDILEWVIDKFTKVKNFIKSIFGVGGEADDSTEGLSNMTEGTSLFGKVLGWVGTFLGKFVETITKIPWGKVAKFAGLAAVIYKVYLSLKSLYYTITAPLRVTKSVTRAMNAFSGTLESFGGFGAGAKWKNFRRNILAFAGAILMIVAAIAILTTLDQERMRTAVGVVIVIAILLIAMKYVMEVMSDADAETRRRNPAKGILSAAIAIFVMAMALAKIAKIDKDRLWSAVGVLAILALIITAMMVVLGFMSIVYKHGTKNGSTLIAIAAALYIAAMALSKLSKIKPDRLWPAVGAMALLAVILVAMAGAMAAIQYLSGTGSINWLAIIGMAVGLFIAAKALQEVAKIDPSRLEDAQMTILILGMLLAAMVAVSAVVSGLAPDAKASFLPFIGMAAALYLAAKALQEVAEIDPSRLDRATLMTAALGGVLTAMVGINKLVSSLTGLSSSNWFPMIAMAGALYLAAKALQEVAEIDPSRLDKATVILAALGGVLVVMVFLGSLTSALDGVTGTNWLAVVGMAAALWIAAQALESIAKIDPSRLDMALVSLAIVALILVAMLGVVGIFSGAAPMMLATIPTLMALAAVVVIIGIVLGVLASIKNADKVLTIALSISLLLGVMSGVMIILAGLGAVAGAALPAIGTIALVIAACGVIFGLLGAFLPEGAIGAIERGIAIVKTVVSGIGEIIASLITGFLGETARGLAEISPALDTFTDVMTKISNTTIDFDKFNDLVNAVTRAANAGLGIAMNNFVASLFTGETSIDSFTGALTDISTAVSDWQETMEGLGEIVIPEEGITKLSEIVESLQYDNIFEAADKGIENVFTGGKSKVESLNEDAGFLADAIQVWVSTLTSLEGDIDNVPTEDAKAVLSDITAITEELQYDGVGEAFSTGVKTVFSLGQSKIETLNEEAILLAGAIDTWVTTLSGLNDKRANMPTTEEISGMVSDISGILEPFEYKDAGDALNTSVKTIFSLGIDRVKKFDSDVDSLSQAISTWATNMDGVVLQKESIPTPEEIQALVDAIDAVPKESLWTAIGEFFTGKTNLEEFGNNAEQLGTAISKFSTALGDNIDTDKMTAATGVATELGTLITALTNASVYGFGAGELTLFGNELSTFGTNISDFTSSISDIDKATQAATAAADIAEAATALSTLEFSGDISDDSKIESFKKNLDKIVGALTGLNGQDYSGIDRLQEAVDKANSVELTQTVDAEIDTSSAEQSASGSGSAVGSALASGFSEGAASLTSNATSAVTAAADAIKAASGQFQSIGFDLMSSLGAGIINNSSYPSTQARLCVGYAVAAASGAASGASEAGRDFATGFANGISNHSYFMTAAARIATRQAINASKDEEGAASPAKETKKLGKWFTQGFANGIAEDANLAVAASRGLVDDARDGLLTASSIINSMVADEFDMSPTISPVLDLSEIQNGAVAIGDMLNSATQIGVGTSAIDRSLAHRVTTNDVVSALDMLGATLGAGMAGGDTYVVNGVTYDDGTNVANAVGSLVRAIKVGRRA